MPNATRIHACDHLHALLETVMHYGKALHAWYILPFSSSTTSYRLRSKPRESSVPFSLSPSAMFLEVSLFFSFPVQLPSKSPRPEHRQAGVNEKYSTALLSPLSHGPLTHNMFPPLLLVLDFDSTLTTSSTLPAFLSIPTKIYSRSLSTSPRPPPTAAEFANLYADDIASHTDPSQNLDSLRRTLAQEVSYQDSLRPLEEASFRRGCDTFRSVRASSAQIRDAARRAVEAGEVNLRKGWQGAFMAAWETGGGSKIVIVSVAWSPIWIRGVLDAAARQDESTHSRSQRQNLLDMIEGMEIRCNDVLHPPPRSDLGIYVSSDKLRVMESLCLTTASNNSEVFPPWTISIGDSPTDLECLIAAEVGIVMRDEVTMGSEEKALKDSLRALDIDTLWIGVFGEVQTGEERVLWWARDFEEVVGSGCLDSQGKILSRVESFSSIETP